jgi:hypothetical protein
MKVRRMCGGGARRTSPRELRAVTSGSGAWALIHDRTGLALVLRDPANDWPRQPWPVVRRRAAARAANAAGEARMWAYVVACRVLGHQPAHDDAESCARCRGWAGA